MYAVNAFVHAKVDEKGFMRRYRKPGAILKLNKALYGLRKSPLLWLWTSALKQFHMNLHIFYVDDIVIAYKKGLENTVHRLIRLTCL